MVVVLHSTSLLLDQHLRRKYLSCNLPARPGDSTRQRLRIEIWIPYNICLPEPANAAKMERMFSKPFITALEGHADAVEVLSRRPNSITDVTSASWDRGAFSGELCKFSSDLNRHSDIILHNAGRRTHLTKIAGVHQGKISGLCWADDHRVLSCGADRNIKMWDVRLDAPLDSSGAGPSHVCFVRFHV